MKRKNATRSALFTSIISLLLCVSMLVGTTFAWFTDTVESGRNIIAAGNLDVELYHSDKNATDVPVDGNTILFDDVNPNLWEPGAVAYENLQVKNVGTLALKYQLSLTVLDETVVNGYKLSDVIMVGLVPNGVTSTDRASVIGQVDTWVKLSEFKLDSSTKTLAAGAAAEKFGIVLYWQPNSNEIDNHYNLNNGQTGTLKLDIGVNLYATQVEAESDSFGKDYDEDAWVDGFDVHSAQDLQAAINNGETVIDLMADIETAESIVIPADAEVKLNLSGKSLEGNIEIPAGAKLTVGNGTIANTDSNVSGIQNNGGELVLDNVTVESARHGVRVEGGNVTINGGEFRVAPTSNMTVHALNVSDGATVTINGGTFVGPQGTIGDSGSAVCVQAGSTVIIKGGNFSGGKNSTLATKEGANLTVEGGTFDQDPSAYVADGYEAVENGDGTLSVIFPQESFDDLIDNAGANDTIEVPAGTYTFPASKLQAGQTLNCAEGTVFTGTSKLNINGATVIGATFSNPAGTAADQTINGTFKDCTFTGTNGLRWAYAGETVVFENCVFDGSTYGVHFDGGANEVIFRNCTFSGFNALGGAITKATLENCTFKANGRGNYNGINLWGNTDLIGCTFVFDGSVGNEWVDLCGDNKTVSFTDCVVTDGTTEKGIETVVGDYGAGNTIIIDGAYYAATVDALQAALDKATEGTTIRLAPGVSYGNVELGRSTKSNDTVMYCETHNYTTTDAAEYKAHLSDGAWHSTPRYTTTLKNLTIIGAEGATISGLTVSSGHMYGDVYDYVLDKDYDAGSAYYNTLKMENIVFSNVNFTGKVDINTSDMDSVYNGVTFDGCTFTTGGTESANGAAIRYYNESNNGNVKNIDVKNSTFNNCYQGIYVHHVNGITVTGSSFDTTGHNAIAIQGHDGAVNLKNVVITGNTFNNIADRVIRFNNVGADSNIIIQNNVATNAGDDSGEIMKATSIEAGVATNINGNTWCGTVANTELQDK